MLFLSCVSLPLPAYFSTYSSAVTSSEKSCLILKIMSDLLYALGCPSLLLKLFHNSTLRISIKKKKNLGLTVATFLNDDLTKTYRFILKQMIFATKTKLAFKEDLPSSLIPCCQMWQTGILIPGRWTRAVILKLHYLRTLYIHQND